MRLDGVGDPDASGLDAYATVEEVRCRRDDRDDDQRSERPGDRRAEERQFEQVEADVAVELRVFDPHRLGVAEQDPVVPLAHHRRTGHQGEHRADDRSAEHVSGTEQLVDALEHLLARHEAQ